MNEVKSELEKLFNAQLPWALTILTAPFIWKGFSYEEALEQIKRPITEIALYPKKALAALEAARGSER